jgi:hypothetical protein
MSFEGFEHSEIGFNILGNTYILLWINREDRRWQKHRKTMLKKWRRDCLRV